MKRLKSIAAIILCLTMCFGVGIISASAAETETAETSAGGITIHYYYEGGTPYIYYWNTLPQTWKQVIPVLR